jgi:hypothetical protein
MIYILKRSKKRLIQERSVLSVGQTKYFICKLGPKNFKINEYLILGSDNKSELDEVFSLFVPNMFIKMDYEMIDAYKINDKIDKQNRLSNFGASINSILNFKQKIKNEINGTVDIYFFQNDFEIYITTNEVKAKVICNYLLEILDIFLLNDSNYNNAQEIKLVINRIFRKQRYYYKKRNEARK